jgi:TM2 domain-containing membrane protein YozV
MTNPPPPGEWYRPLPAPYQPPQPPPWNPQLQAYPPIAPQPYPSLAAYSDKSKVTAGLLQTLLGFFLCIGGVGRLYAGHTTLGAIQLVAGLFGWFAAVCGFWLIVPLLFTVSMQFWFLIDGIVLMTGQPVDNNGRPLRS